GTNAILQCEVAGTGPFEIGWFKDKKQIRSSKKYRLTSQKSVISLEIAGVQLSAGGKYTCVAENDAGSQTCFGELAVKDRTLPPFFTKPLRNVDSIVSGSCRLDCKVAGSLPMTVSWFKRDTEIKTSAKYTVHFAEGSASLEIKHLDTNDAGLYTCRATNSAGVKETNSSSLFCDSFRRRLEPPSFVVEPESQEIVPGSTVRLKSTFKGTTPLTIKWFKGDTELEIGGACFILTEPLASYLELYAVKPADSGEYICKASNVAGSVARSANLFVKEPAAFADRLEPSQLLKKGDYAQLACKVTGSPEIKITWFKNDREIKESDKYKMSFSKSMAILKLMDVAIEDSGEYLCEARNDAGKDTCSSIVTVKESPYFSKEFEPMEVLKDSDVVLECEVLGTPPFEVFWVKDDKPVRSSKKHRITAEKSLISLHIFRFDSSDAGEYQCRVTNDVGTCFCSSEVALKEPPQFVKRIENISSLRGGTVVFQAAIKGSLPITVSWLKDNDEVVEDNNVKMTFVNNVATLLIRSIELKHDGKYFCQAKNDAGIQRCSALLTVKG
uniref:Ig-like domain-containing protein n=1 Tax=Crocodylus porosus TaxID=8502 RepID=A0A7M4F499_CROPO